MKYSLYIIAFLFVFSNLSIGQKIQLSSRKDRVLPIDTRENVLKVSDEYLNPNENDFLSNIEDTQSPFSFPQELEEEEPANLPVKVNYDDASVLEVIASNFLEQITGTLIRGSSISLQLDGGGLVKTGYSFPVRIPEIEDRTFDVTITEITESGIRMVLGDVESFFPYKEEDARDSITRDTE
ncbi:MAG: hypothetical protein AAGH40_12905 [Verrucomicrobiota bacterium]